jgi:hypothetical protein
VVSIQGILRMLHPPHQWGKGATVVLLAYMDPSGTHLNSPVISISGFVAEEAKWNAFDQSWRTVLEKPYWPSRLSRFHTFDCVHCEGEFFDGRWRFAERLALYGELTDVIRNSGIRPIGSSVVTNCFSKIPPEDLELLRREENRLGTPLDVVFHMVTQQIIRCVREFDSSETVGVMFDQDDRDREGYFSEFAKQYMSWHHHGETFAAFGFGDGRNFTPLQAADLLAYGTHHLAQITQSLPVYYSPDFPVIPAFWGMLTELAGSPLTSPLGLLINLEDLKAVVEKVKRGEMLPRKDPPETPVEFLPRRNQGLL